MDPGLDDRWMQVEGRAVHLREHAVASADQPPLVFVHGLGVSGAYMAPLASRLGRARTVFVPDLPGSGPSERPEVPPGVAEEAGMLLAWLDAAELQRPVLIANSLGCQVAMEVAAQHPGRVAALVLLSPTVDGGHRSLHAQLARWAADIAFEPLTLVPVVGLDYLRYGFRRLLTTFSKALAHVPEATATRVLAPTLIVRGTRDPLVPRAWAEELALRFPMHAIEEVPGAGHALCFNSAVACARLIDAFLASPPRVILPAATPALPDNFGEA